VTPEAHWIGGSHEPHSEHYLAAKKAKLGHIG
jgi:hypothetical protein